ncbi:protein tesmin/TSO1-like CXC 2 [Abrus precatorius]|uniref:Protein tesmin/TSO1-like CXC 2 n=1 Tax=Abrus precatorius TaxID=3816 RepID=A0A8B8M876_ABRPR|nr:protein tesmin/TSO1-like CXC 2 [Abrus precatorius]
METPERNKINADTSQPEDSPVFNYMNTLSPVKPIKSVYFTQPFNSLSFPSPPPVFTSPHANCPTESGFLRRHDLLDTSTLNVSSEDVNIISLRDEVVAVSTHACYDTVEMQENTDQQISVGDGLIEPSNGNPEFLLKLPQALKYNSGTTGYDPLLCSDEANSVLELPRKPAPDFAYVSEGSEKDSVKEEIHIPSICHSEAKKKGPDCDCESFVTGTSNLLMFGSSIHFSNITNLLQKPSTNRGHGKHIINPIASGSEHETEGCSSKSIAASDTSQEQDNLANDALMTSNSSEKTGENQFTCASQFVLLLSASQEQKLSTVPASVERDLESSKNVIQPAEDFIPSVVHMADEDFQQNNQKKKRRKLEPAGEMKSCKGCSCKKSKCLKLYCACFSHGVFCTESCSCKDCINKPINADIVAQTREQIKSRDAPAFSPKISRNSDSVPEIGGDPHKTTVSARHKKGCNCKKSRCQQKYCECFQGNVGCSSKCRCEGCKNLYGRRVSSPGKAEPDEETEACEKGLVKKASQKTGIRNIDDHPDSVFTTTPSGLSRPPFPSEGMQPRSVATMTASGFVGSQMLGISDVPQSQPKFENSSQTDPEDESALTCIKISSSNAKRISSQNGDFESSPTCSCGRKLTFPSGPPFSFLAPPR